MLNPEAFFYKETFHNPHYSDLCRDIRYRYQILLISLTFLNITSDYVSILKSNPFKQIIPAFDRFVPVVKRHYRIMMCKGFSPTALKK